MNNATLFQVRHALEQKTNDSQILTENQWQLIEDNKKFHLPTWAMIITI